MIIRILLVTVIIIITLYFFKNLKSSRVKAIKKIGVLFFAFFAVMTVIFPNIANTLAHEVGVGRGADLLLYSLAVAFIIFVMNQYIQNKSTEQKMNTLARKIAIFDAEKYERK